MDSIATTSNDFNENPVPMPQPRSITTREHYQSSSISRYVTNTTTHQVSRLDPNILPSSFKPQEPHLSLRREKPAMTINTGGNTLPGFLKLFCFVLNLQKKISITYYYFF